MGGGVAGCELAQLYRRLGSEVTIVQRGKRLMPRVDRDAAELLQAAFEDEGIRVLLGADIRSVRSDRLGVSLPSPRARERRRADGRAAARRHRAGSPNVEGLGLEQLGVEISKRGIETDEGLRAAEGVWAIGDCTGVALFTHVGKYQARVAARNVAGRSAGADYRAIPAVAFTDPQVAMVGDTESEGLVRARWELTAVPRTSTYEKPKRPGFVKVAADPSAGSSSARSRSVRRRASGASS